MCRVEVPCSTLYLRSIADGADQFSLRDRPFLYSGYAEVDFEVEPIASRQTRNENRRPYYTQQHNTIMCSFVLHIRTRNCNMKFGKIRNRH